MNPEHSRAAVRAALTGAAVWCLAIASGLLARILPESWQPWPTLVPFAVAMGTALWLGVKAWRMPRRSGDLQVSIAAAVPPPQEPTHADWYGETQMTDTKPQAAMHGSTSHRRRR